MWLLIHVESKVGKKGAPGVLFLSIFEMYQLIICCFSTQNTPTKKKRSQKSSKDKPANDFGQMTLSLKDVTVSSCLFFAQLTFY